MENWKLAFPSNEEDLRDVPAKRRIFQGDSLSPLVFVLYMISLSLVLRKTKALMLSTRGNRQFQLNHLLIMDDLKLFAKNKRQIDSLVNTVHIFSTDIHVGMEFELKTCGILVLKRGKVVRFEGIKLPDREVLNEVKEDGYT